MKHEVTGTIYDYDYEAIVYTGDPMYSDKVIDIRDAVGECPHDLWDALEPLILEDANRKVREQ